MNRRIPNGTYGGVRGRGLIAPSYSIGDFYGGGEEICFRKCITNLQDYGRKNRNIFYIKQEMWKLVLTRNKQIPEGLLKKILPEE